ncbi:MAG: peptidoglycan-binding protein [Oscillospiraceae bacterium]|nr:peptidoglycan-binding protein [Oscillospiraceae bacterium]
MWISSRLSPAFPPLIKPDPATEKAVRSFRAKAAPEPDGGIGADTWAALISA